MVTHIDRRKAYYLMIDTETANSSVDRKVDRTNALCYDIGFAVIDKKGNIYETYSFVVDEIFFGMADIMASAYYADKIPKYLEDIADGKRIVANLYEIRATIKMLIEKYQIVAVVAHNALFDYSATNATQRYITKSKYRYFFPYDTVFYDTLKMAQDTICKQKSYQSFCFANGYVTKHKAPRPKATAEIIYKYITGQHNFSESHTGLEDVLIEAKIFAHCMRQHKKMRKNLFQNVEKF